MAPWRYCGILTAQFLKADVVATPVSCNTAVDKCGSFKIVKRTRIGSPYVIAAMHSDNPEYTIAGYEANGGFLTATDFICFGNCLPRLCTRDAVLPMLAILSSSIEQNRTISELQTALPARYTASDRLKEFPSFLSQQKLQSFNTGDLVADIVAVDAAFGTVAEDVTGIEVKSETHGLVAHIEQQGDRPAI